MIFRSHEGQFVAALPKLLFIMKDIAYNELFQHLIIPKGIIMMKWIELRQVVKAVSNNLMIIKGSFIPP